MIWSIAALNGDIDRGTLSCEEIVRGARERAEDPQGEGARVFRVQNYARAGEAARAHDMLRAQGIKPSPLAGLPVSVKDNVDVAGEVSAAGSKVLLESPPANEDAPLVRRLRQAGAVVVGRTNMSELAFTGVGLNPHFGTPANPCDRATRRIPGGSSAGAAVSVTDRMAVAAIGTDTGGSVRIPAALTGLAGFKPTKRRVPTAGVVPLSTTLDCVGPLATSLADCALLDAVLSGDDSVPEPVNVFQPRLWFPGAFMMAGSDSAVQKAFERALRTLGGAGAIVGEFHTDAFDLTQCIAARGSISTAEVWERFGPVLRARRDDVDPNVFRRIERGAAMSAADYIANLADRARLIEEMDRLLSGFDAIVAPTVPIVAPALRALDDEAAFQQANGLILRNPAIANLLDRPSLTIPCHAPGEPPVGLMLIGHRMQDKRLLSLGLAVERLLNETLDRI